MIGGLLEKLKTRSRESKDIRRINRISKILERPVQPDCSRAEKDFDILQNRFQPIPEYGYDAYSLLKRASERALEVCQWDPLSEPGSRVLDVGAGDSMLGVVLHGFGHQVELSDQEDWRCPQAKRLDLKLANACEKLPYDHGRFDAVVSFNSFEHFPDPAAVFAEMLRISRPGGLLYFNFGPLYASAHGLHAYRMVRAPFAQYLFSKDFIQTYLKKVGVQDLGKERAELQFVNEWRFKQFEALWNSKQVDVLKNAWAVSLENLQLVEEYPECFQGRGLTYLDLIRFSNTVALRKK
jgi:SAM-dependent methyltransferase